MPLGGESQGGPLDARTATFLAGGGEMGERIRAFDWSTTPLGSPDRWPQSLKTAVRILLTSRQPIWIGWGPELIYFYNDPYKSIIGGKHPEMLGQPTSVVWEEIWPVIRPMLETAMNGVEGTYVESQLLIMERHGYREETYYTFSYSPIPDDEGNPGGIICANTEDTQRVIGERQLALLRDLAARTAHVRTWREACERSMQALATNPRDLPFALIYLTDADGANFELSGSCGLPSNHPLAVPSLARDDEEPWPLASVWAARDEIEVREVAGLTGFEDPKRAAIIPITSSSQSGKSGALVVGLNPYRLLDEGYENFLRLVAGQISASIASGQAFEEERRRSEALSELDRAKTQFFSNVSHEFRTPLTLMLGPIEDLMSREHHEIAPGILSQLEVVHRNSLRLLKLVNTMLDFSRIEAGRVRARYEPTDLAGLTTDLASVFRAAMERAGLRYLVDCGPLSQPAYVDRDMWEKIVLNLISNAFKFTLEGEIEVRMEERDHCAVLTVRDTGVGVPPEEQLRIFERFHRVDENRGRTHEGTGIGLALVQELIRLHGGSVELESEVNVGSTFTVRVPLGKAHLDPERVLESGGNAERSRASAAYLQEAIRWLPDEEATLRGASSPDRLAADQLAVGGRPRILLADDNADMREYVGRLLEVDYEVEAVPDGQAALEAIQTKAPDLVLSDIMMPRLDGFGLVKAIREDPAIREVPIILLSARAGEEARIEGIVTGADDYLVKPFSSRELIARVEAHVRMSRMRQEAENAVRESERRFRAFADAAPAMLWVTGYDGDTEFLSQGWFDYTGQAADVGLGMGWLNAVHPDDQAEAERAFAEAHRNKLPFVLDYRVKRHDGVYRWAIDAGRPLMDANGEFAGFVGSVIDVHERKEAERQVHELNEALEQKVADRTAELLAANEQLQGFTYSVAHDLRQEIRGISTNASILLLEAEGRLDVESRHTLNRLVQSSRKLGNLVDDLLAYARLGRQQPKTVRINLSQMAAEVLQVLRDRGLCKPSTKITIAPDLTAFADPAMLRIVLENLLDNGCKYSMGRAIPTIEVGREGDAFYVRDNGIGFEMEFAHKLFTPFERLHWQPEFAGTGIGLANVKRIIEKHGGKVWASAVPDQGATFYLTLPLVSDPGP